MNSSISGGTSSAVISGVPCAPACDQTMSDKLKGELSILNDIGEILDGFEILVMGGGRNTMDREEPACMLQNIDMILVKTSDIRNRLVDLKNVF